MKKLVVCFFSLFILLGSIKLKGTIHEVEHFTQLHDFVDSKSLVLLDIDDTLLIPVQTLGTDVWFLYRMSQQKSKGMEAAQALENTLAEWEAIRHLTQVKLVEMGTDTVVKSIQSSGARVMGLTTQGLALATRTVQQLQGLGINLSLTSPSKDDFYFHNPYGGGVFYRDGVLQSAGKINTKGVLYRDGILFTSGTMKGIALITLLNKIGYRPDKVIFINDKLTHLKDVEEAVEAQGIPFIGLRYAYSDARTAAFDPKIAEEQFRPFQHILSDQEALQSLSEKH